MTIKELIPKLIAHYEKCINEMPEEGWRGFTFENSVQSGICSCAKYVFKSIIYDSSFANKFTYNEMYLCEKPMNAKSYQEAKELLQIRLRRLREFL